MLKGSELMELTIRKYRAEDKENLLTVLYETSSMPIETEEQREFLRLMFNDYYTEQEPDNCFVVADGDDSAVGYILCAEDYDTYERVFKEKYAPRIKKLGKSYSAIVWGEFFVHKLLKKKYPSHLHIDILPVCQGKGAGSRLVDALCEHLKEKNSPGLMLSCGMGNKGAIRFYSRNGFEKKVNFFGNCLMCRKIK